MFRCFIFCLFFATSAALGQAQSATQVPEDPCADARAKAARSEARLKDWPALARYHDSNSKVTAPLSDSERVVFMGDSITDNWTRPQFGGFFPGKPYINRGISGQTTPQMLIRFRPDVIALKPAVVVILAGTNDIAGNTGPMTLEAIEDNLASMVELAQAHKIRVVLASLLPISDYEKTKEGNPIVQSGQRPPEQIKALNEWLKKYASATSSIYLDYYSAMVDDQGFLKKELSADGLHPNAQGYALMAPLVERAIVSALKRRI